MRRTLAVLLALGLLTASCGDDGSDDTPSADAVAATTTAADGTAATTTEGTGTATTEQPDEPAAATTTLGLTAPDPSASAGCTTESPEAGTTSEVLTTADGRDRTYRLHVPADLGPDPVPLVLDFHGFTSNGDQQAGLSGFTALADAEGFVVANPFGTIEPNLGQTYWNTTVDDDPITVDDVAFVAELLDALEARLCLDLDRVYSTGMSNGGFFSARLACDLADRIAAIGTVTGVNHYDDCAPTRPVPVLHFHGTDDPIVPFEGGSSTIFDVVEIDVEVDSATVDSFFVPIPGEMAEWATTNGCGTEPDVTTVTDEVELREYPDCDGAETDFYVFDGGHTWPGSETMLGLEGIVGGTTLDVDATALIWAWFEDHPRA